MTLHLHLSRVAGCYRCELSADEVEPLIEWDSETRSWWVGSLEFPTLLEAELYITRPTPEGEQ
jgi:hypothetical protein